MMQENPPPQARLSGPATTGVSRGYTVALAVYASLLVIAAIATFALVNAPTTAEESAWALQAAASVDLFLAVLVALVVSLRATRSSYSYPATAALSWFLLIQVPVGTAYFLYWFFRVRSQERAA